MSAEKHWERAYAILLEASNKKIAELEEKLQIAQSALEFYTLKTSYNIVDEGNNYNVEYVTYEVDENTYQDNEIGTVAREALEKIK